jgi:hypothetical protein
VNQEVQNGICNHSNRVRQHLLRRIRPRG